MTRVRFLVGLLVLVLPALGSVPSHAADLVWTDARTTALLKAIRSAGDHGLNSYWYRLAELEKAAAAGIDKAQAEPLLTEAFLAYASDLSTGRVRANGVDKDIEIQQRKADRPELLKAVSESNDLAPWLAALAPKGDYPVLQKTLADLRAKRASTVYTPVPSGGWLKPGMTDARVPALRTRLAEL